MTDYASPADHADLPCGANLAAHARPDDRRGTLAIPLPIEGAPPLMLEWQAVRFPACTPERAWAWGHRLLDAHTAHGTQFLGRFTLGGEPMGSLEDDWYGGERFSAVRFDEWGNDRTTGHLLFDGAAGLNVTLLLRQLGFDGAFDAEAPTQALFDMDWVDCAKTSIKWSSSNARWSLDVEDEYESDDGRRDTTLSFIFDLEGRRMGYVHHYQPTDY